MEQYTQYLMWVKSKDLIMNSFVNHSTSWEEQAFAEDAHGPLGGFVWPPRSYPCSFCKREFRSAQALGGHMNIHRRERARLKQSHHHHHPSSDPQSSPTDLSKSLESTCQNPSSSIVASSHHDISPPRISLSPNTLGQESFSSSKISERVLRNELNNVETGLFMGGINLDFWGNSNSNPVDVDHHQDVMVAKCKRQKTAVLSLMTGSRDGNIDLELRLGDSYSKVK